MVVKFVSGRIDDIIQNMHHNSFDNLLRLMKLTGGKYFIVEDGEPQAVLMDYQEFEKMAVPHYANKLAERASRADEVNQQIAAAQLQDLREEVIQEEPEEVRLEPIDSTGGDIDNIVLL